MPEAGWYTDPNSDLQERWWDGSAWSEQTRPRAPAAPPPPPYAAPMVAGFPHQPAPYAPVGAKSRMTAGLLGIFLGGLGVHRFYLGYTGIGIAQIAVSIATCGLGSIWGFIEGILILTKSPSFATDAQGNALIDN